MKYYSATKKNEVLLFAAILMNLETVIPSEVRQRQILCDIIYMWNLKQ